MTNRHHIRVNNFLVAALSISCFFLCSCENDQKTIDEWTKDKVMREEATHIESYFSQEGRIRAKLVAPLMYRVLIDTPYVEFPRTMHVDFYNDSSKVESKLDCLYGKYFESQNKVYLRDSVTVVTVKGDTLKSPDLWWDQNKGIFYTDKYARYRAKNQDIQGHKGMTATQDLKTVTFIDPTGIVDIAGKGIGQ